jgi:protein tyrosine phosphatase (PTP) superfamily phosphohydrolase (DUF442 family)
MPNADLAAALKRAKTKPMAFGFVSNGATHGELLVSKSKVPPAELAQAKKDLGGGQIYKGRVFWEDGVLVFGVEKEPPGTLLQALHKVVKAEAGLTGRIDVRVMANAEDVGSAEPGAAALDEAVHAALREPPATVPGPTTPPGGTGTVDVPAQQFADPAATAQLIAQARQGVKVRLKAGLQKIENAIFDAYPRVIGDLDLIVERAVYPIKDYDEPVSAGLWRGSRLEPGEMQKLKAAGFKSFVDLRAEAAGSDPALSNESGVEKVLDKVGKFLADHHVTKPDQDDVSAAHQLGLNAVNVPIVDNTAPTVAQMVTFLDFVTRKENRPAYVHCEAGVGRTGVAVAVYRMAVQGWPADRAIDEAKKHGMALPEQEKFIRDFAGLLAQGKIPGFPVDPPEQ